VAKKKPINKTATKDVEVDFIHWSNSIVAYDSCLYGFPLLDLFPDLQIGHGIKLRVTVEVLNEGIPCPVRSSRDEVKCTKPPEKKRKAKKVKRTK